MTSRTGLSFFLCSTLVSCTALKIYHLYSFTNLYGFVKNIQKHIILLSLQLLNTKNYILLKISTSGLFFFRSLREILQFSASIFL